MSHGLLTTRPDQEWRVNGIDIAPATKTRKEEYAWALEQVQDATPDGPALDAACGYMPTWHVFSYILAASDWTVEAVDSNAKHLEMPPHPLIHRTVGNICDLEFPDEHFQAVFCISTLEHLSVTDRVKAADELVRVLRPGGQLVVTADEASWLPTVFNRIIDIGDGWLACGGMLKPPVYALSATK